MPGSVVMGTGGTLQMNQTNTRVLDLHSSDKTANKTIT